MQLEQHWLHLTAMTKWIFSDVECSSRSNAKTDRTPQTMKSKCRSPINAAGDNSLARTELPVYSPTNFDALALWISLSYTPARSLDAFSVHATLSVWSVGVWHLCYALFCLIRECRCLMGLNVYNKDSITYIECWTSSVSTILCCWCLILEKHCLSPWVTIFINLFQY